MAGNLRLYLFKYLKIKYLQKNNLLNRCLTTFIISFLFTQILHEFTY
ncbi:hypothetical protein HMPREF1551_01373 [Capnocytophaga sp. oral taxon 863 str. F0517]|nr:hypothetical protein HMPREF1551_01373 [Capnocytophaga sp. oral taxon 863 str. F0517]